MHIAGQGLASASQIGRVRLDEIDVNDPGPNVTDTPTSIIEIDEIAVETGKIAHPTAISSLSNCNAVTLSPEPTRRPSHRRWRVRPKR